ncbi:hypothetical protein [Paenibacillus sp. URB8-2]|uniref:hypothetical protein n=1 Tax=Paenibacillus sp. URB8-2 TaxID=2741301 RepID=UPI0015BD893D|nr:hypothetical protein [Paenibacillus sp. URB8-2]BCG58585.1 hypothetical protein PUR_20100 [Paenibacillus sp. URB8-2]
MLTRMPVHKRKALYLFGFLLISDIVLYLLQRLGYYLMPYLSPPGFYILLYHVILIVVILLLLKKVILTAVTSPFLLIILGMGLFLFSFMEWKYAYLQSPGHKETLVVKYRVATLGESTYSYEFYQQTLWLTDEKT